ncbi:MAG TPA: phenylalanine--tRNA ligase subunit beta [Gemmatimonadota bacterium]|nr:phenylalanine--tRNA ligase subunit beta [Gemmatimonadota bacterium]
MRVSYRWLTSFFPQGSFEELPPEELAQRLTRQGLAVDDVRPAFAAFTGVVLGKVVQAGPHPNADRLTLCEVEAGDGARQVVCGAPNVEVGAIYGYATVGSRLPGDRQIRRAKIRGIESQGMLCSAPELGLEALGGAEGIWPIGGASEADLGRDLRDVLALDDTVLDIDVTSNRGDALSHLGIAREVQWIVGRQLELPAFRLEESGEPAAARSAVEIEDVEGCPRYFGRLIDGVRVGTSPAWLQTRLVSVGQRPVSDVVDVTNYVMLELGQPLHPFDFERLAGGRIVVRRARDGERFVTLDGKERTLDAEITMICDAEGAVAIGGVMGGLESEISEKTRTVFLESAHFDSARVARAVRKLGLPSEASTRFARGVDPELPEIALDRAAAMIAEVAGGEVAPGRAGADRATRATRPRIELRLSRHETLVGKPTTIEAARKALETLGFGVTEARGSALTVEVPSWRFDVSREADLIEEVARLEGYEAVPATPLPAPPVAPARTARQRTIARLSEACRAAGFDEACTPSFVSEDVLGAGTAIDNLVEIRNPISKADRFLRPSLIPNLAGAAGYNLKRGALRAKLFEIGHAFASSGDEVEETEKLALAAAGARSPLHWSQPHASEYDFWDLKGDLEDVLAAAAGIAPRFSEGGRSWLHPGRQAEIQSAGGIRLGFCGEVHPVVAEGWGADRRLFVAELELAAVTGPDPQMRVEEWGREPAVERDLALVVPAGDLAADVLAAVSGSAIDHLADVRVFDRYAGPQVPEGHYSLGLRLTFEADRTLTDEEVDGEMTRLLERLRKERGYEIR